MEYTGGWYYGTQDELTLNFYREGTYNVSFSGRKGYEYPGDTLVVITYPKALFSPFCQPPDILIARPLSIGFLNTYPS